MYNETMKIHSPKYQKHIFTCVNERSPDSPRQSCGHCGGHDIRLKFAQLIQEHNLKSKIRSNKSLCLDACEFGPSVVIYPNNLWYTGVKLEDVEEIFHTSVLQDGIVDRLVATEETWQKLKEIRDKEPSKSTK